MASPQQNGNGTNEANGHLEHRDGSSKVAVITGGTSGIGLALGRHLHAQGWRVALVGRRVLVGEAHAAALDASQETARFFPADVASYSSQAAMFKQVWAAWGRVDVAVLNAGGVDASSLYNFRHRGASVDEVPPEPDLSCTEVDFKGVIYGTVLATHFMRHNPPLPKAESNGEGEQKASGGRILVTGSMLGVHPCPTFPEYGAVKAGVHHWVRVMAPLLKSKEHISINAVMMGAAVTPVMPNLAMATAFLPEHLALPRVVMQAFQMYIDDGTRTGETVETAHEKMFYYEPPEWKAGSVNERNVKVFEPWFKMIHGEDSNLPNALLERPVGNAWDAGLMDELSIGCS